MTCIPGSGLLAAAGVVVLAACAAIPAFTPGPAAAEGLGGKDGKIIFGYRSDAPPFSFAVQGDVAAFSGFTAELCSLVFRDLSTAPEAVDIERGTVRVGANDRFDRIESGEIDVLCGAASVTAERRTRVSFSIPVLETGVAIALAGDASDTFVALLSSSDLAKALVDAATAGNIRIGYRTGTTSADWVADSALSSAGSVTLSGFPDHRAGIAALTTGEIDLYVADLAILRGLKRTIDQNIQISNHTLRNEEIALALSRDADDLRQLVDGLLRRLYVSGGIEPIFERHFGSMSEADRAFYRRNAMPR